MSNNIYDIMKKLNAVSEQDVAPVSKQGATLLESTMKEVLNEKYMGFDKTVAAIKKGGSAKDPEAVAASIGRKKYGKEKFQTAAAKGKKLSERVSVGAEYVLDPADIPMPGNKLSPKDQYQAISKDVEHVDQRRRGLKPGYNLEKDSDVGRFAAPGYGDQGQFFQEDDMEEGNKFTGNLAKARAKGKKLSERTWTDPATGEFHGSLASRLEPNTPQSSAPSLQQQMADQAARRRQSTQQPAAQSNQFQINPGAIQQMTDQSRLQQQMADQAARRRQSTQQPAAQQNQYQVGQDALQQLKDQAARRRQSMGLQPKQESETFNEDDMEEGNKFTGNLAKARAAGKKRADLDGDGDMETVREGAKPDYIDLDKDGNRKESMKKAAADKKKRGVAEGTKETSTGRIHKSEPGGYGRKDDEDEDKKKAEPAVKRGRGRPKKDADSETGEVKKWDTDTLQRLIGGSVPKKLPGKASVKHKIKDEPDEKLDEVAPPGAKAERMVKNIKKGYAKDGKVTPKEKGIAYATAWKAKKAGKVEESIPPGFPRELAKRIYEHYAGDMNSTLTAMWNVHNTVMESKVSRSKKKLSEGMTFEQSTTKPAMGTYKGGVWTADPPKKGEVGVPAPSPDEGAPVSSPSKKRPAPKAAKEDVSENKELSDVLKLAGMVEESVKVDECGMSPIGGAYGDSMTNTEGSMSISTNMSTDGNKTVTISADGDAAGDLMKMLKLAGINSDGGEDTDIEKMSEEKDDRYEANTTPEQEILPVQTQLKGGNGEVAGKEKKMTPHGYKFADNPLAMKESMTLKLMKEYESIKKTK